MKEFEFFGTNKEKKRLFDLIKKIKDARKKKEEAKVEEYKYAYHILKEGLHEKANLSKSEFFKDILGLSISLCERYASAVNILGQKRIDGAGLAMSMRIGQLCHGVKKDTALRLYTNAKTRCDEERQSNGNISDTKIRKIVDVEAKKLGITKDIKKNTRSHAAQKIEIAEDFLKKIADAYSADSKSPAYMLATEALAEMAEVGKKKSDASAEAKKAS